MTIKSITRGLPVVLFMLVLSACAVGRMPGTLAPLPPTATVFVPTRMPTKRPPTATPLPGPDVDTNGVKFHLDPSLGMTVGESTAADDEEVGSTDWMLPIRTAFPVTKYPHPPSSREPLIVVFAAGGLDGFNDYAAERIQGVKDLLENKPASGDIEGAVPQVAVLDEDELFHAQVKYLDFKNGSGVRFIAIYASDIRPITNEDLVYIFQGITADGDFISVVLPLTQADLHNTENGITDAEADALLKDFDGYLEGITKDMDIAKDDTFKPSLALLDSLVQSFDVKLDMPPMPTPYPTPTEGGEETEEPEDTPEP